MITVMIQARLGSTRLPRKVMQDISGKSMLSRVIERAQRIPDVSSVIVATSTLEEDQWVIEESRRCGVQAFRGPVEDVLSRYEGAASFLELRSHDLIVRITADCPLLDPFVSHQVIQLAVTRRVDYASNLRDWPDGLDTEVFTRSALHDAFHLAAKEGDREHVTPWMRRNLFCLELPHEPNLRHFKLSVDTQEDLEFIRAYYKRLGPDFSWKASWEALVGASQEFIRGRTGEIPALTSDARPDDADPPKNQDGDLACH